MQDGWTSESTARSTLRVRRPHATSSRLHRTPLRRSPGRIWHETETVCFCVGRVAGNEVRCGAGENPYPDVIPLGCPHFWRIFQDMPKSQIKAAKKRKSRRRAPVLYHGIVVRKPHVAPDTPLPVLRKAVRSAVRRYFDGSAAGRRIAIYIIVL